MEASMSQNETNAEKRSVLAELEFTEKTAKRASWEAHAYEIVAENQIEVTNESYGAEADDHTYTVTVERLDDGRIIPIHCSCPSDMHGEGACKHRVSCAATTVVLGAAVAYTRDPDTNAETEVMLADGGQVVGADSADETAETECVADEDWCSGPKSDDLPCFECFRAR